MVDEDERGILISRRVFEDYLLAWMPLNNY
ncbi:MAG: hypothetical protein JWM09_879 [Francisellaceae bacterium]|nr:hypothetical protein [Francisellaceae bacterium]